MDSLSGSAPNRKRRPQISDGITREVGVLDLGEVDLPVATASVPGFAAALATRLGWSAARVGLPSQALAGAHTAALAVALESVRLEVGRTALFVSVRAKSHTTAEWAANIRQRCSVWLSKAWARSAKMVIAAQRS